MNLLELEQRYINLISSHLPLFKWKKSNSLANCRCPVCGDSATNQSRARGYFYLSKNRRFRYKCQNCGINWSSGEMVKYISPVLYDEYRLEYMKSMGDSTPKQQQRQPKPTTAVVLEKPSSIKCSSIPELQYLTPVSVLPVFDAAYKYLTQDRCVPREKISRLYHTNNLQEYLRTLVVKHGYKIDSLDEKYPKDARIVMPFIDNRGVLLGMNCRVVPGCGGVEKIRYITVKLNDDAPMIYGLDHLDPKKPVYCVEGPLDSLYLPNAVAVGSSGLLKLDSVLSPKEHGIDVTYIHDNQPRNKEIVREVNRTINSGNKVCIWEPNSHFKYGKDIGDMIEYGMTPDRVLWEIQRRTFSGVRAKLEFDQWKKI